MLIVFGTVCACDLYCCIGVNFSLGTIKLNECTVYMYVRIVCIIHVFGFCFNHFRIIYIICNATHNCLVL